MLKNDYVLNLVNKLVALISGFAISVVLARHLGVALRGEYAFVTTTASTVAIVLTLGLNQTFSFYYKHRFGEKAYGIFVRIFLGQFALHIAVSIWALAFVRETSAVLIIALLPGLCLYQQFEAAMSVVNVRLKIWANVVLSGLRVVGVALIAATLTAGLWPLVWLHAFLWVLLPLAYILFTRVGAGSRVSLKETALIVRYSFWPMMTALLVVLSYNIDVVFLKFLGSPEDLGLYSVASSLVVYMWAYTDGIKEVLVSRAARSRDPRLVLNPLKLAVYGSVVIIVAFFAIGRWAVPFAYGNEFAGSYTLTVVLSLGVVSMAVYKILGVILLTDGRRAFYFGALCASVGLNCVGNWFTIPEYGAVGAAWTSVASYTFTGVAFLVYYLRKYELGAADLLLDSNDLRAVKKLIRRL